jgi:hypothetical protein
MVAQTSNEPGNIGRMPAPVPGVEIRVENMHRPAMPFASSVLPDEFPAQLP